MRSYQKMLVASFLLMSFYVSGQQQLRYSEVGAYLGTINYSGEIATTTNPGSIIKEMRPQIGVFIRRNYSARYSIGLEATAGWIYSADENHSNKSRNWVLSSPIIQINGIAEFNVLKFGKFYKKNSWTPYLRGGFGMAFYYPNVNGLVYDPETMNIESGSTSAFNYVVGLGAKFRIGRESILSVFADVNGLLSDNIEGFTYLDSSDSNDFFGGIKVGYTHCIF